MPEHVTNVPCQTHQHFQILYKGTWKVAFFMVSIGSSRAAVLQCSAPTIIKHTYSIIYSKCDQIYMFGIFSILSVQTQSKWSSRTIWGFWFSIWIHSLVQKSAQNIHFYIHTIIYTHTKVYFQCFKWMSTPSIYVYCKNNGNGTDQWTFCIKAPPPFEKSIHKTINNRWKDLGKI